MVCPKCGNMADDSLSFCPHCGNSFEAANRAIREYQARQGMQQPFTQYPAQFEEYPSQPVQPVNESMLYATAGGGDKQLTRGERAMMLVISIITFVYTALNAVLDIIGFISVTAAFDQYEAAMQAPGYPAMTGTDQIMQVKGFYTTYYIILFVILAVHILCGVFILLNHCWPHLVMMVLYSMALSLYITLLIVPAVASVFSGSVSSAGGMDLSAIAAQFPVWQLIIYIVYFVAMITGHAIAQTRVSHPTQQARAGQFGAYQSY